MKKISAKKQALIEAKSLEPLQIDESVYVKVKDFSPYYRGDGEKLERVKIVGIEGDDISIKYGRNTYVIKKNLIAQRDLLTIGANPFSEEDDTRFVAFSFSSIIFALDILDTRKVTENRLDRICFNGIEVQECNWNPFIYDENGNKKYYQRPFVWSIQDKQLLIESIYQGIDCGKIVVRKRGYNELKKMSENGETELAWHDIVDGKQRLNAVAGFIKGEFPDAQGNYFDDLSFMAQNKFNDHQLFSYAEMPEEIEDIKVIRQFLKMNFAGVPQSLEHIEFVKSLLKK